MHQTEVTVVENVLVKLDDNSDDMRRVVIDLLDSGFDDVDQLVELATIARESIVSVQANLGVS